MYVLSLQKNYPLCIHISMHCSLLLSASIYSRTTVTIVQTLQKDMTSDADTNESKSTVAVHGCNCS